ncbi:unnamed protein product [Rhizoctonia solani]|uniref:Uncharacterized protein n=1 Tax=Rhizoctonia solani TaxID=456999 RepID=A0A8H3E002_9AGAM|nr:unnamed protein product [Rhizoctonia solani]
MEVMNLTRDVSVSPSELTNVSGWATRHGGSQDLILLIQDAWRFATTIVSSPVGQSTPHIYVSMLPFLSSHSPIRKHYGDRMHGMVGVEGTAQDRRKGRLGGWVFKRGIYAACSSDCNLLAIVPRDCPGVISLVDVSSGRLVRDMSHDSVGSISCLAFSPDGTRVASGTDDKSIWVWDHNGQLVLGPITGHSGPIRSIVYSHNGAFIISGSEDHTIRIWDANSGNLAIPPLLGITDNILCIVIPPDDTKIISGSSDGTVRVWDMQSGCPVFDLITKYPGSIKFISASPNGKFIATGSQGRSVGVWDIQTGQAVAGPFSLTGPVTSVAISPDSLYISVGLLNGTIQIWDVLAGQVVSEQLRAHRGSTTMLAYSPDGARIISYSSDDGSLCVFDAHNATATVDTLLFHPERILSIDISPHGNYIISGSDCHSLRIWDRMTGELVNGPLTGHSGYVHIVHYSAHSHRILSCSHDGTLRQWDAQTGDAVQMDSPITAQSSTRDSSDVYFRCATYSPDGGYIATGSSESDVCIWCSSSGKMVVGPMHSPIIGFRSARAIMFSEDGMTVITGWFDGTVDMWNAKSGKLVSSIQSQFRYVSAFAFSADGLNNVIVESLCDKTMHQQITQTGDQAGGSFHGHTNNVSSAQYSPDGTRIVSGSHDKTVHIWDTQSATSIFGPLEGHTNWVRSVAYSPDGTFVASGSGDTTIRIWDVTTQSDSPQASIITFYQIDQPMLTQTCSSQDGT